MSNPIPTTWEILPLRAFLGANTLFTDGDWVESKDQDEEGANRLIQLADIGDGEFLNKSSRYLNDEQFKRLQCTKLNIGDILIARMPEPLGRACILPNQGQRCATVVDVAVLRNPTVDNRWLVYSINSANARKQIEALSAGTTRVRISKNLLGSIVFPTPPIEIQECIAIILKRLDAVIEKTEALIKKYQQIKAGLMHDLFTRGIGDDGKLRPPREQAPELYQKTAIGWIPKEWEIDSLATKAKYGVPHLRTGPFGSALKGEHWKTEGCPVITIGALGQGEFDIGELLYVGEGDARRLSEFKMSCGDVVFSRVADVGRSVVVRHEHVGWIMSSNLMRISLDRELVLPDFLQFQLSFDARLKKQIRCRVNSGGRDVANSDILNKLSFVWPTIEEQIMIVERASKVSNRIDREKKYLKKLRMKKSGLMHDLLTGKVEVGIATSKETEH